MTLRCKWFGHKYDLDAAYYYSEYYCVRCDRHIDNHEPGLFERWHWGLSIWFRDKLHDFKQWFHCSECDLYFGRHDDSKDHIPF